MIDIEQLSLDELFELNGRIIRRVQYLQGLKTQAALDRFSVGDTVSYQSDGRTVQGVVIRVNRKTLSIKTKDSHWNIPPRFVTKLSSLGSPAARTIEEILGGGQG